MTKIITSKYFASIGLIFCVLMLPGTAAASLMMKLDDQTIFTFDGNYYTYYGTNDSFTGSPIPLPVGFGIEVQGTSSPILGGDHRNYGLVVSGDYGDELLGNTTYNAPFGGGVPNATVADITVGSPPNNPNTGNPFIDHSGSAEWALSYSNDAVNPIPNPLHSVLFGGLPNLFSDPSTYSGLTGMGNELYFRDDLGNDGPGGSVKDRLDLNLTLNSDGIYHSVNAKNSPLTNFEYTLPALSDLLAGNIGLAQFYDRDFTTGVTAPGILTLTGSVYEIGFDDQGRNVWVTNVPEPTTLALLGLGLAGIGYGRCRSKKAA